MDYEPLKVGIVGFGHYVRCTLAPALRACEAIDVVGVYNRGEQRRSQAAEAGFRVTGDLDELLGRDDVEAIVVGTHNAVHREHAVAAARAGKHIFCEKPLALTREDVAAMVAQVESAGVITHVNHGAPYTAAFEKLRELMSAHCGRVMQVWVRNSRHFGTWRAGARHFAVANPDVSGGWTFHHTCHFLNVACVLIDSAANPATRVYHVKQKSCPDAPSEELVTSVVHFANGATATISDGTSIGGFNDLGVIGTDADVRLLGNTVYLARTTDFDPTQRPGNLGGKVETFDVPPGGKALDKVARLFAEAVRTGDAGRLLSFGRISHEYSILAAMARSAETGQAVEVT